MHHMTHMDKNMKDCIETCNECRDECEATFYQHCLEMGEDHAEQKHVRLMADCIEICQTAAHFMLRGSEQHMAICAACADICDACADSCEELDGEEMKNCAETCRKCAESCRAMGGSGSQSQGTGGSKRAA